MFFKNHKKLVVVIAVCILFLGFIGVFNNHLLSFFPNVSW
ncbi:hypothetical protein CLFE_048380 (plasmid) [Clostridium felsineum DSM 794]|nr:hypothetical protein CLFE_048380 [Clostridium felsineum DSM 794]